VPDQPSTWIEVSRSTVRRTAEDHSLVLEALGIPNGIGEALGTHVVLVRVEDAARARSELARFVGENQPAPSLGETAAPLGPSLVAAAVWILVLVAFDVAVRRGAFGDHGWRAGVADAASIRAGEWWRSLTALTLHADVLHLAGNLAFGAAFGVMLAQSVGYGLAWLAFVVTGGIGNWLNAFVQQPPHTSIGASTAVFGILGVQVAHDWVGRRQLHYNPFRRWAPIAIGAALLAWFGGDGRHIDPSAFPKAIGDFNVPLPKIDVGAHVLGFAAGVAAGGVLGWIKPRWRLTPLMQAALAGAAAAMVALAWVLALR
jgi:membrane associated rhomboid family serine protease